MSTTTQTGSIKLTTIVRFEGAINDDLEEGASRLDRALVKVINDEGMLAIKQYFVRPVERGIEVGLRFEGMAAEYVQDTADDILNAAISSMSDAEPVAPARRTSTTLTGI